MEAEQICATFRRGLSYGYLMHRISDLLEVVMKKIFIVVTLLGTLLSAPDRIALVGSADAQARPAPKASRHRARRVATRPNATGPTPGLFWILAI